MNNAETILRFLEGTNSCCDDCIARETHIEPRQQVNNICRRMELSALTRYQDRCALCGRTKTINVIRIGEEQPSVAPPMLTARMTMSRDSEKRARIICGKLDLNEIKLVGTLLQAAAAILSNEAAWYRLEVYRQYYFRIPDCRLPRDPGWYVICDAMKIPLYVGEAQNLDARLNTTNGSLDQFANSGRTQDPARNFIKALTTMGYIPTLHVGIISELDILNRVGIQGSLDRLDRGNVEKLFGLFRHVVVRSGI
jgi:hypothetical protein